jgi:hypothetical protein
MTTLNQKQGTVKILRHTSAVLKNNPLGDRYVRDVCVYLPPDYESNTENRFPAVYCLTGFTGRGRMLLNDNAFTPNLAERMDLLISENRIKPMIVVMPDCFTYYGVCGHCYTTREIVIVPNVDEFPGHIVCSSASKSEIVLPVFDKSRNVFAVLDVDSDKLDDFSETDANGLQKIVEIVENLIKKN